MHAKCQHLCKHFHLFDQKPHLNSDIEGIFDMPKFKNSFRRDLLTPYRFSNYRIRPTDSHIENIDNN